MSRRAWLLFGSVTLLWGIPYVFIEVALHDLSPALLAFLRVIIGFAVLAPYAWRSGAFSGLRSRLRPLLAYTVVELVLAWPLIGLGEQRVSTSQTATLLAAVPLILAALMWRRRREERVSRMQLAGLVIGFAGVLAFVGPATIGSVRELIGSLAVLGAATCYAIAPLIIERDLADLDPVGPVAASFGIAACLLAPFALATAPRHVPGAHALAAVAVLGVACSAIAFVAFFALIAEAGPARGSLFVYLLPIVATVLGVAFLGERVGPTAGVGLVLILAGSRLASRTAERDPGSGPTARAAAACSSPCRAGGRRPIGARVRQGRRREQRAKPPGGLGALRRVHGSARAGRRRADVLHARATSP